MNDIKFIVIHCSDTPDDRPVTTEDIHQWHLERGWSGIGYHRIIQRNGIIDYGRPNYWSGAHVKGYNSESLGVCLIGRNKFEELQFRALKILLRSFTISYPNARIVGHCELDDSKTCPNFDVQSWLDSHGIKQP